MNKIYLLAACVLFSTIAFSQSQSTDNKMSIQHTGQISGSDSSVAPASQAADIAVKQILAPNEKKVNKSCILYNYMKVYREGNKNYSPHMA